MDTQLHTRIRYARKRAKLKQVDIAQHLNISSAAVGAWEDPKKTNSPSSTNLRKLAALLGVSLEWLGSDKSRLEDLDAPVSVAPLRAGGQLSLRPGSLVAIMEVTAPAEMELLRHFRRCTPEAQTALLASARALAQSSRKKGAS